MIDLIILVLVVLNLLVSLFGLYAIHRNKDAWTYGADKLDQAKNAIQDKLNSLNK